MLITGFPAGMFQTNCYIVAPEPGGEAIVIDPGQEAADKVTELLRENDLTPVAVLLTHGHLDHTWNAADVCDAYGIPAYIHPADRPMLADPAVGLGSALGAMIGPLTFREPEKVVDFVDGEPTEVAGIRFSVDLAPVCFSGDVLFAGSIGRTDLPGGNHQQLLDSIASKLLPLSDDTQVLPGHGPQTSIGQERATNPFLTDLGTSSRQNGSRRL